MTTLKIVLLAPIPIASEATAISLNTGLFAVVPLLVAWLKARRAASVSPSAALRSD